MIGSSIVGQIRYPFLIQRWLDRKSAIQKLERENIDFPNLPRLEREEMIKKEMRRINMFRITVLF